MMASRIVSSGTTYSSEQNSQVCRIDSSNPPRMTHGAECDFCRIIILRPGIEILYTFSCADTMIGSRIVSDPQFAHGSLVTSHCDEYSVHLGRRILVFPCIIHPEQVGKRTVPVLLQ